MADSATANAGFPVKTVIMPRDPFGTLVVWCSGNTPTSKQAMNVMAKRLKKNDAINAEQSAARSIDIVSSSKSTREELQKAIEETEGANEELQSSNKDLESSKKELQSVNEELSTVNRQLLDKVCELDKTLDALHQSEERIRAILKTASDAIITIDNRGHIDSVNNSTEAIFGYSSSELVGQNVSMLMPQPFRHEHDSYIQRFLVTGEPRIIGKGREVLCRRKDGSTFPADLAVSQVDHLGFFTGILRDISSRKEMQKHILEIASDEQRRIGLELHDGTQQELTGLSLYANALQETIQSATPVDSNSNPAWQFEVAGFERLKSIAELLSKRLAETNQHVRDLAHGIMPIQIDAGGLRSALGELAKSINSNEKIRCDFECKGEVTIQNNTTAMHLYRIVQEAVNNALRHGSADQIRILLSLQDDQIILEVSDNGVGLDNEVAIQGDLSNKGMGMRTMEYRASLIGGRFQIQQGPAGGTLVKCEIMKGSSL